MSLLKLVLSIRGELHHTLRETGQLHVILYNSGLAANTLVIVIVVVVVIVVDGE